MAASCCASFFDDPSPRRERLPTFDDEPFVMIGSDFIDDVVFRKLQTVSLSQLLQCRLVILKEKIVLVDRREVAHERPLDEFSGRLNAAVEIDAGDHRFEDIRQKRFLFSSARFLLAHTEVNDLAHPVVARFRRKAAGADQIRFDF